MNKFLLITAVISMACGPQVFGQTAQVDAEKLLQAVRHSTVQNEDLTVTGQLREDRKKHPFRMTIRKTQIAYLFEKKPRHTIVLDLGAERFRLRERFGAEGGFPDVPPAKYNTPVRKTGVNYLDISLAYLYWPNPKFVKEDVVSERITWVVEVKNPDRDGPYDKILLWIDKQFGALMRMDGFDRSGKLVKSMRVQGVQKVKREDAKHWVPKRMLIYTFDPKSGSILHRTYMDLEK